MSGGPRSDRPLRVAIVCPGRGSYGRAQLGSIGAREDFGCVDGLADEPAAITAARAARAAIVRAIDAERGARGEAPLLTLDAAKRFSPSVHLRADHASELILAGSALDVARLREVEAEGHVEIVCALGNSLGFYLALYAAGALAIESAARLVATMGALQVERGTVGGQLLYPVCDPDTWARSPEREGIVTGALRQSGARRSIRLGGTEVLAGLTSELDALTALLPEERRGSRRFPLRLAGHSAFHTEHLRWLSDAACERLADLDLRQPQIPLIDGRGAVFTSLGTDLEELFDYTLRAQVTEAFDFSASVRVALKMYAPDVLCVTGPGDALGGPIGQILCQERWRGVTDKASFKAAQAGGARPLRALGRADDSAWLAGS